MNEPLPGTVSAPPTEDVDAKDILPAAPLPEAGVDAGIEAREPPIARPRPQSESSDEDED